MKEYQIFNVGNMSRVIYSLYIDIDENELDFHDKNILKKDHMLVIYLLKFSLTKTIIN